MMKIVFSLIFTVVFSYLIGSVNSAITVCKVSKKDDIRNHGSKNIDCKCKNLIKNFRNNLYRTKLKYARIKNKEQEYKLKDSNFKKFGLDLVIVNKKSNNDYTIIPINDNDNSNSDEDPDDMDNLRGTISYNKSKTGDIKESKKRVNIFDVLRKSCK